jgi:hypothetical protein
MGVANAGVGVDRWDIATADYHAKIIDALRGKPGSPGICAEFIDVRLLSPS